MEQQPSILKEIRPHGTESFPACSECLYFINPGELHSIITETSDSHWEDAVVFSPDILSFDSYDEAQIRLVDPIRSSRLLLPRCITPEHPAFALVKNAFQDIMRSFGQKKEAETSQLYIKSSLLYILATLSEYNLLTPTEKNLDKRVGSVKTALTYIKDNYRDLHVLSASFSKKQPDLNWDNPKVRQEVFDMMTWWCEKDIDDFCGHETAFAIPDEFVGTSCLIANMENRYDSAKMTLQPYEAFVLQKK